MISERVGEIEREYSYFSKNIKFHAFEVITSEGKQYFSGHDLPFIFTLHKENSTIFEIKQELENSFEIEIFKCKFFVSNEYIKD